ncbi:MBL fold metallo-hydrolase [Enterococcus sp. AZ192]|uniref:MBL fold metallo-hydrolase n=1 Tax=unclassified Enterococcus TaxID=2608891 RepID=UPI003D27B968
MELKKLTDKIFYYPHESATDRPMLAYVNGESMKLAIDAGNSAQHVDEFYCSLENYGFEKPNITVMTHWHWDHSFGMHHINGFSIACRRTNEFLENEKKKLSDNQYIEFLKTDDECFAKEYSNNQKVRVVLSDIEFDTELTLKLGNLTAKIIHVDSPHSDDTVLIHIPEERVLFLGDATSEDFFNNGYMDFDKLKQLIRVIESIDCEYCILGHTEPLLKSELLDYLRTILP